LYPDADVGGRCGEDVPGLAGRETSKLGDVVLDDETTGAVVTWLLTNPAAVEPNGRNLEAQDVWNELGLLLR
jgi:hypothetical protein